MTLNPIAIAPDAPVDEAARVMHAHKISALPVIEGGRVVGILTTTGILRAFVDLCGTAEPTTRMILTPQDRRAGERQVRQIVHDGNGELKWIPAFAGMTRIGSERYDSLLLGVIESLCRGSSEPSYGACGGVRHGHRKPLGKEMVQLSRMDGDGGHWATPSVGNAPAGALRTEGGRT